MGIHKTAIVDKDAEIGSEVNIGPFSIIEKGTVISDNTIIHSGVVIKAGTQIGKDCEIHHGAVLGDVPQDIKFKGEKSYLNIGNATQIREYATLHRASGEGEKTVIGKAVVTLPSRSSLAG